MTLRPEEIHEQTLLSELLPRAPHLRVVLDRYGLHCCGGARGPAESLGAFARAHGVPLEVLLEELRQSCLHPPPGAVSLSAPDRAASIYRPFFLTAIGVALTLGATWGAYLLGRIATQGSFRAASLHEINAHGFAQIYGWVGLFVMGFAYQVFPRFKQTRLAWPTAAWISFALMAGGLVLRGIAEPWGPESDTAAVLAVTGNGLAIAAVLLFAGVLAFTWQRSPVGLAFYDAYIIAALFWFIIHTVAEAVYLTALFRAATDREAVLQLVATWQGALRILQVHGFATLMILGVSQKLFHHFYQMLPPRRSWSLAGAILLNGAVILIAISLVLMTADRRWASGWYLGQVLLTATLVALLWDWKIFQRVAEPDRTLKFMRTAYLWLLFACGLSLLLPAYQWVILPRWAPQSEAARIGFSHAYYGAIRHATTVGFISLMIMGVAARVVPAINGIDRQRLTSLWGPFVLLNLGCALRVSGQIATDLSEAAYLPMGLSGILEVTALAWWGLHLVAIMFGLVRQKPPIEPIYTPGTPIEADHTIGAILDRYPQLLDTFTRLGFAPLQNPLLRQTLARSVTLRTACRWHRLDLQQVLQTLNDAREQIDGQLFPLPLAQSHTSTS